MADNPYNIELDANTGAMTPGGLAAATALDLESQYPTFTQTPESTFRTQAGTELSPSFDSAIGALGTEETIAKSKTAKTYKELLERARESYNRRGVFFSGQAMTGEQDIMTGQAEAEQGITSSFAKERSSIQLQKEKAIADRISQLQKTEYDTYVAGKEASIGAAVAQKVKEYIPTWQAAVKAAIEDKNSLWMDLPLGDEAATSSTVSTGTFNKRDEQIKEREYRKTKGFIYVGGKLTLQQAIQKYGKNRVQQNSYGDYFVVPA